jgi:hypothetical protein
MVNIGWLIGVLAGCNGTPDADTVRRASHVAKTAALNALCPVSILLCYVVPDIEPVSFGCEQDRVRLATT